MRASPGSGMAEGCEIRLSETSLEAGPGNHGGNKKGSSITPMGGFTLSPSKVHVDFSAIGLGRRPTRI